MSYSACDFADDARITLERDGYSFHQAGDEDYAPTPGAVPEEGHWYCWAAPGMSGVEVGPTCSDGNAAVLSALEHRLANSSIPLHLGPVTMIEPDQAPAGDAITVPCTLTYPDQLCYDLMCTAAEGGINYWADIIGQKMRKVPGSDVPDYESFEADIQDGPVACDHPDIEAAEIGRFTMDAALMRQGIARLLAPDAQVSPATRNCVLLMGMDSEADQGDAETADSIVQFAVFGELVFG